MATLVAIGYPDEATAEAARETVAGLEQDLIIQADQVAAIRRDQEGKYHITTTHGGASSGGGAVWGGFWGFLFGLIFFVPFKPGVEKSHRLLRADFPLLVTHEQG